MQLVRINTYMEIKPQDIKTLKLFYDFNFRPFNSYGTWTNDPTFINQYPKIEKEFKLDGPPKQIVAPRGGLEPPTCGLTVRRSTD